MVEELRKVILTKDEVVAAIDAYRRTVTDFLPTGEIVQCQAGPDSTFTVAVKLAYGKSTHQLDFNFKLSDLLGALIQFCVENNIILPRNSRKCIKMEGERVALYIVMEAPHATVSASTVAAAMAAQQAAAQAVNGTTGVHVPPPAKR